MVFEFFTKKSIKLGLFSTILLGCLIKFNFSESHPAFASATEEQAEDNKINHPEQKIDYKKSNKYFGIAIGYSFRGEFAKAIENFNKAIAFDPENVSAYVNRGNVYLQQSLWNKALADYNRAVEIDPKLTGRVYYNRGTIYEIQGKLEEALADYDLAIELRSSLYPAYFKRGNLHLRQENWLTAIKDFEQVIQLKPEEDQAYFAAGFGYLNLKKWDQSLEKYNQGMLINTNDGHAYFSRGFIHANNGDITKAIIDCKKAKKIFLEQEDLENHQMVEQFLNNLEQAPNNLNKPGYIS